MHIKLFLILGFGVSLAGCGLNPVSAPPDIRINRLLASPDTITVDGTRLCLSTYMWRSFQPISPPDGQPLITICYVTGIDTTQLPTSISADAVWIVNGQQVWSSWLVADTTSSVVTPPNQIVGVARNGPQWGPQINVNVIVRVTDAQGNSQLLRASDQWIGRTD